MNDITELVQRENFELWAEECNALPWGYLKIRRTDDGFYTEDAYTSLWGAWKAASAELVEALERKEEQRANWFRMAQKLGEDMDAAEKLIAGLESRNVTVKLPRPVFITVAGERSGVYPKDEVEAALTAQGIKVEAE